MTNPRNADDRQDTNMQLFFNRAGPPVTPGEKPNSGFVQSYGEAPYDLVIFGATAQASPTPLPHSLVQIRH